MDIQFILDLYACAVYILSYITKGQRGMSTLLQKACGEANSGNKDNANKVKYIGNKFLNAVEVSAQEAETLRISVYQHIQSIGKEYSLLSQWKSCSICLIVLMTLSVTT